MPTDLLSMFEPLPGRQRREAITLAQFIELFAPESRPAGRSDEYAKEFERFRARVRPGDELWVIVTEQATWDRLMGSAVVQHVRNGKLVDMLMWAWN